MKTSKNSQRARLAASAALLLVVALLTGCGKALPTSPMVDSSVARPAVMNSSSHTPCDDGGLTGDAGGGAGGQNAPEVRPLVAAGPGADFVRHGHAWGRYKPKKH